MLSIFLHTLCSPGCLRWRNADFDLWPTFPFFLILIELHGLFACFGDEFLVSPFANTFFSPPILKVLFLSFIVYPAAQMLLRLMKSHLLILLYYSKNESKKNWLRFISSHVLYMFLKSFIVSIPPFRSLLWRMFFCMGLSSVVNSSSFH